MFKGEIRIRFVTPNIDMARQLHGILRGAIETMSLLWKAEVKTVELFDENGDSCG